MRCDLNLNTVTLWAMWKTTKVIPKECIDIPSIGQTNTMTDSRDNNKYGIARLLDGRCWMTQNLKIGSNSKTTLLSPSSSDITKEYTLPKGNHDGFSNDDEAYIYISDNQNYGAYYSWKAATAGQGSLEAQEGETISSSICPKGWRLPTYEEAKLLTTKYTYSSISNSPFKPMPAGNIYNGNDNWLGNSSWYWTSTAGVKSNNNYMAGYLAQCAYCSNSTGLFTAAPSGNYRAMGFSIRCIAYE